MPKSKSVKVELRLPIPVLAFYEGVAAYSGLKIDDVIRVVLAIEMLKNRQPNESLSEHTEK